VAAFTSLRVPEPSSATFGRSEMGYYSNRS